MENEVTATRNHLSIQAMDAATQDQMMIEEQMQDQEGGQLSEGRARLTAALSKSSSVPTLVGFSENQLYQQRIQVNTTNTNSVQSQISDRRPSQWRHLPQIVNRFHQLDNLATNQSSIEHTDPMSTPKQPSAQRFRKKVHPLPCSEQPTL